MSEYWKGNIVTEFHHVKTYEDPRVLCGVLMDPKDFLPNYLRRMLVRWHIEGNLPPPGYYRVQFKVPFRERFKELGKGIQDGIFHKD